MEIFHGTATECHLPWDYTSDVNKDLSFKAKAKAKDLTSEHVQGPL